MIMWGWTLGQTMVVAGYFTGLVVGLLGMLIRFRAREDGWRDRIASAVTTLALIIWIAGMVNGFLLWDKPLVTK